MKLLPRIIGRRCERCRLFVWVCVWLGICVFVLQCVCRAGGVLDWWLPLWLGNKGPGEANRLFPQSVLLQPPLTHGAARRWAGSHGKKGTNKNNRSTTQSQCLWKASGEASEGVWRGSGWRVGKCDREDKNDMEMAQNCIAESYFWFGSCQILYCQYLKIGTHWHVAVACAWSECVLYHC